MPTKHNKAVRKLGIKYRNQSNVEEVYTDHISKYPDPAIRVGDGNHIPDLFIKFTNGREKIVEVDSGTSMSSDEREQHRAFQRSADSKPNVRSYDHYYAHELL